MVLCNLLDTVGHWCLLLAEQDITTEPHTGTATTFTSHTCRLGCSSIAPTPCQWCCGPRWGWLWGLPYQQLTSGCRAPCSEGQPISSTLGWQQTTQLSPDCRDFPGTAAEVYAATTGPHWPTDSLPHPRRCHPRYLFPLSPHVHAWSYLQFPQVKKR